MGYPTRAALVCGLFFALSQAGCESDTDEAVNGATADVSVDASVGGDSAAFDTADLDTSPAEDAGAPGEPDTTTADGKGLDSGSPGTMDAGSSDAITTEDGIAPGPGDDAGGDIKWKLQLRQATGSPGVTVSWPGVVVFGNECGVSWVRPQPKTATLARV